MPFSLTSDGAFGPGFTRSALAGTHGASGWALGNSSRDAGGDRRLPGNCRGAKSDHLGTLRRSILEVVPDAEQCISYGTPAFKVDGRTVAGFAAFKSHLS